MEQSAFQDRKRQIEGRTAIAVNFQVQSLYKSIIVEADFVFAEERVSLARHNYIFISVQHYSNWPTDLTRDNFHNN